MSVIWNWLRNRKNLAVLVALGTAIGFLINFVNTPSSTAPTVASIQPSIVLNPQIHIQNNPANIINATNSLAEPEVDKAQSSTSVTSNSQDYKKQIPVAVNLPVRRYAGAGIPVEIVPGFSVTVTSISGFEGRFKVELASDLWDGQSHTFPVGAHPVDITIEGRTYQLSVDATDGQLAEISLNQANR